MFERFTTTAREVVRLGLAEAERAGADFVGTEHLLMGMLAAGDGRAYRALTAAGLTLDSVRATAARMTGSSGSLGAEDAEALRTIGIDLDAVIERVEQSFGPGALTSPVSPKRRTWGTSRLTKRAKKVLELGLREAKAMHHNYIGSEHLLLGLIREGGGLGAKILVGSGVSLSALRASVVADLDKAA
jgi:ATP-dependent Clp protease ATP-binding subunit ClpA